MENEITLSIKLTFTEDANVTEKDSKEIIINLLEAVKNQINSGMGIAPIEPEHGDYITDVITIKDDKGNEIIFDLKDNKFVKNIL